MSNNEQEKDKELLNPDEFDEESKEKEKELEDDNSGDDDGSNDDNSGDDDDEKVKAQKEAELEKERKRNAEFAEKRRKQEEAERNKREAEIRAKAEKETKLKIYKVNTFTDKPIVDEEDLKIFEIQKDLEAEGKNPIDDLPSKMAEILRNEKQAKAKQQEVEQKNQESLKRDIADFKKKYPEVNLVELTNDEEFLNYSNGKVGRWSTIEIYECYLTQKESSKKKIAKAKETEAVDDQAKNVTKTPGVGGKNPKPKSIDDIKNIDEYREYMKNKYH